MSTYPCFISFRHYKGENADSFIKQFVECLNGFLDPLCGESFIDYLRMQPGYDLNPSIASALCQSACMVVIWTPRYFDEEHPWCAKEYKAMLALEKQRLEYLPIDQRMQRLIIPVIFSGKNSYPASLRDGIIYYDFSDFMLYEKRMSRNRKFADKIRELANYIFERLQTLKNINQGSWFDCNGVNFSNDEEIFNFIKNLKGMDVENFPFRS